MDPTFWHERWQRNEIGFHQATVSAALTRCWRDVIGDHRQGRVFVPLCGKSLDMVWLKSKGHSVVGIELSDIAVNDFFHEQALESQSGDDHGLPYRETSSLRLYCGDFFDLTTQHLGSVEAIYDRAALIALPPSLQQQYVDHLLTLLPGRPPVLLVTLTYDRAEMDGPPFSVQQQRVRELYGQHYEIVPLYSRDVLDENVGLKNRGLHSLTESAYCLRRDT